MAENLADQKNQFILIVLSHNDFPLAVSKPNNI